jgi:hypothetical protein
VIVRAIELHALLPSPSCNQRKIGVNGAQTKS